MGQVGRWVELYEARNVMFEEENFGAYRPGGFHPVTLGDTLKDGRYEIQHELGWGGFATVWLARDHRHKQWVSVKIIREDRTDQARELHNLRELAQRSHQNPGSKYIVRLLDEFVHHGPNGCHQCLVFELLGPTVAIEVQAAHEFKERLETDTIIKVSTQVLEAIAFMHEVGYAHGDLSIRNVAFYNRRLHHLSQEELFAALGPPELEKLERSDGEPIGKGVPSQLVESASWNGWPLDDDEFDDDDIRIIDLGSAFHQDTPPEELAQTKNLTAPEMIFANEFDHRQDLWCVGLLIFHLIFGYSPYGYWNENSLVMSTTDVFGDIPPKWERQWEQMRAEGAAKGSQRVAEWVPRTKYRVEKQFDEEVHEPELKGLLPVIQGLTKLLPEDRISASQALQLLRQNCGTGHREGSVEAEGESAGEASAGDVEGGKKEAEVNP